VKKGGGVRLWGVMQGIDTTRNKRPSRREKRYYLKKRSVTAANGGVRTEGREVEITLEGAKECAWFGGGTIVDLAALRLGGGPTKKKRRRVEVGRWLSGVKRAT